MNALEQLAVKMETECDTVNCGCAIRFAADLRALASAPAPDGATGEADAWMVETPSSYLTGTIREFHRQQAFAEQRATMLGGFVVPLYRRASQGPATLERRKRGRDRRSPQIGHGKPENVIVSNAQGTHQRSGHDRRKPAATTEVET